MRIFNLHMSTKLLILIPLLWVYSCAVGPKFKRHDVTSPEKFSNDTLAESDSVLNLKWWEIFKDTVLDSLIKAGLANNKDLLIATSRIEQSRATLGIRRSEFYPQINIGGALVTGNYGGGLLVFGETREALAVNGQVSWEIDFWGKIRRSTESAKADLLASEYGKRNVQISLISEIARTYFLLLDYKWRYAISTNTERSRDSANSIIDARFRGGIAPEIDLNQSQIQLAISRASVPYYEREITVVENNLSILLGQNPKSIKTREVLINQVVSAEIPSGIPSELLNRRPDILQSEALLHAQTARIGVAQANRLPSISLTGLLGSVTDDLSNLNSGQAGWNAGVGLFGPLFQFGKNKRRVQVEKEKTEQAVLEYEKSVLTAFSEVEIALKSIQTLKKELDARKFQYDAAMNAERLSFERYNGGVTSYLEVLENQRSAFDAQLLYSQTYQQYLTAHVSLYKALGGGWISEEEMNEAQAAENK